MKPNHQSRLAAMLAAFTLAACTSKSLAAIINVTGIAFTAPNRPDLVFQLSYDDATYLAGPQTITGTFSMTDQTNNITVSSIGPLKLESSSADGAARATFYGFNGLGGDLLQITALDGGIPLNTAPEIAGYLVDNFNTVRFPAAGAQMYDPGTGDLLSTSFLVYHTLPTPEPQSLALLGVGATGILMRRRARGYALRNFAACHSE